MNVSSFSQTSDLVVISADKVFIRADSMAMGTANILIKEGYHIQSNEVDDEYIIPTRLDVTDNEMIQMIEQVYPDGKDFRLEGSEIILNVFDGEIEIRFKLITDSKIIQGEHQLGARLHYQACDAKSCFAPRTIDFLIPIEIIK